MSSVPSPSLIAQSKIKIQKSLKTGFELSGVGLHTGVKTNVRVLPAFFDEGRYFVRVDIADEPIIPALVAYVVSTTLSTELGISDFRLPILDLGLGSTCGSPEFSETKEGANNPKWSVRTVEHLLAALAASGIDNARIEIDGPEVPLLDGSAKVWVEAIAATGIVSQEAEMQNSATHRHSPFLECTPALYGHEYTNASLQVPRVSTPVWIHQGDAFVAALPSSVTCFTYGIDFDLSAIGKQWHTWSPEKESFATEIAPARTFGLAHQIDQLRASGLIKGGSLDNALVCGEQGWFNPPLRFSNEPVRHKLLDLVGDISLLGNIPIAHFLAYKASHNLHIQLVQNLAQSL